MDINEDQLDKLAGKIIKEYGHERPSSGFTRQVLLRLGHETAITKYGPLIPPMWWIVISGFVGVLVIGVLGGLLPDEITALERFKIDITGLERFVPSPNFLEISSPFVYGTLTLVFFVYLQVILLRRTRITRHVGFYNF